MTTRIAFAVAVLAFSPVVALADGGGMPAPPTSGQPAWSSTMSKEDAGKLKAAEIYAQAYREIDKAKAELAQAEKLKLSDMKQADAKTASAQKRLEKSRDKLAEAVKQDPTNADAWNMLGFTRRKTGDRPGAFDAYWKCLGIKADHIGAHEYLGEAYLEEGKLAQAKEELEWLKKKGNMSTLETTNLATAIDAYEKANPDAAKAAAESPKTATENAAAESGK
jgi:cytochrome c-type biogenesis protein CcmH/NrfG